MKCPVCGEKMEKRYDFSGDLRQSNDFRYVCTKCGYGGPSDDNIFVQAVCKLQKEMEEESGA